MSDYVFVVALAFIAGVLAIIELSRTRFQDLLAWAVLLLGLAVLVDRLQR